MEVIPPGLVRGGVLRLCAVCAAGGETEEERVRVDIVEKQVMDTRIQMGTLCYSPDFVSSHSVP